MEKFLDELILSERKKRKEKVLDKQIDLERDLPEQYLRLQNGLIRLFMYRQHPVLMKWGYRQI